MSYVDPLTFILIGNFTSLVRGKKDSGRRMRKWWGLFPHTIPSKNRKKVWLAESPFILATTLPVSWEDSN
jgi:hypothetical protein